jgi:hypothetical protein
VLGGLLGEEVANSLQVLFLESEEGVEIMIDFLNLLNLLEFDSLFLLQLFEIFLLLLNQDLHVVDLPSNLFVLIVQIFPLVSRRNFVNLGLIELHLYHFQLFLFRFLIFLLSPHPRFLLPFPFQHRLILAVQLIFLQLVIVNFVFDLLELTTIGLQADGENFLLLLKFFVGNGVLMNGSDLSFSNGIILLHQHMQLFHLGLQSLYLLLGEILVLTRELQILISLSHFSLQIGDGVRIIVGELKGRLQLCGPRDYIL